MEIDTTKGWNIFILLLITILDGYRILGRWSFSFRHWRLCFVVLSLSLFLPPLFSTMYPEVFESISNFMLMCFISLILDCQKTFSFWKQVFFGLGILSWIISSYPSHPSLLFFFSSLRDSPLGLRRWNVSFTNSVISNFLWQVIHLFPPNLWSLSSF